MHVRSTDVIEVTAIVIANVRKVYMANRVGGAIAGHGTDDQTRFLSMTRFTGQEIRFIVDGGTRGKSVK